MAANLRYLSRATAPTPYSEGVAAGQAGKSALTCPYAMGSPERRRWLRGFTHGQESFRAGRVHGGKLTGLGPINGHHKVKSVGRY